MEYPSGWRRPDTSESHEGKTLERHISEVESLYNQLLEHYGLDKLRKIDEYYKYFMIIEDVIKYHDMGKLHPGWSLGGGSRVFHSVESVYWILYNKEYFRKKYSEEELGILNYLILRHHSRLKSKLPVSGLRNREVTKYFMRLIDKYGIESKLKRMDKKYATLLADLYGIFKIADIISAENIQFTPPERPKISIDSVRKMLSINGFDKDRFNQQIMLANTGSIAVLRAYTGWGKTTSSLLYAVNKNYNKIFYVLPTITAINRFYDRLSSMLGDHVVGKYFYFYDSELMLEGFDVDWVDRLNIYLLEKLFLIYPVNITTIDQLILSFLRIGKYHVKRLNFRNSILIIDEIHLLTPFMLEILLKILDEYWDLYGFKVLFMSATLPDRLIEYICDRLGRLYRDINKLDFLDGYRKVSRVRYKIMDSRIVDNLDTIVEQYRCGNKVLVMFNRVEDAILAAHRLIEEYGLKKNEEIILLHGRYMFRDRRAIERRIEDMEDKNHIFISTQVSEVSLDISYRYLHTELSPIPSLIQRFGRVNRRGEYGRRVGEVNVYIYHTDMSRDRWYLPYEKADMETSINILPELEGARLENEYQLFTLYNENYNIEPIIKASQDRGLELLMKEFGYLYSPNYKDTTVKNMLSYREEVTGLALPDPDMIYDEGLKGEVEKLINMWSEGYKGLSYKEKERLKSLIKSLLISAPLYMINHDMDYGFPVIDIRDNIYDPYYGLAPLEVVEYVQ